MSEEKKITIKRLGFGDKVKEIQAELKELTKNTWCGNCADSEQLRYLFEQLCESIGIQASIEKLTYDLAKIKLQKEEKC